MVGEAVGLGLRQPDPTVGVGGAERRLLLIPLVAEGVGRERVRAAGHRDRGVAPESQVVELGRHLERLGGVVPADLPAEGVLGLPAVVAGGVLPPQTGPRVGVRVAREVAEAVPVLGALGVAFFVRDEGAVVGAPQSAGARFPAGLPVDLVATEEGEVDPVVARGLDVVALLGRPVLVVAHRHEGLVLQELAAAAGGVDTGEVADVVAVALEPAEHRVLGVEEPVLDRSAPGDEGAVVAHLVGVPGTRVEAVAAVAVVRLPGGVRCLEQEIGVAVVVAHDEGDVARPAVVGAPGPGDVETGGRVGRHRPRRRRAPVAAVDEIVVGRPVDEEAVRLIGLGCGAGGDGARRGGPRCRRSSRAGRCRCGSRSRSCRS